MKKISSVQTLGDRVVVIVSEHDYSITPIVLQFDLIVKENEIVIEIEDLITGKGRILATWSLVTPNGLVE